METYESLIVIDPTISAKDWSKVTGYLAGVVTKHKGEVLLTSRWGERHLAYRIGQHKRGTYVLMYFKAPRASVERIRHDYQLSELIVRFLIMRFSGEVKEVPAPEGF